MDWVSRADAKARKAEYDRQRYQDPEIHRKTLENRQAPEARAKRAEYDRQRWKDPEIRAKRAEQHRRWQQQNQTKQSEYSRRWWEKPGNCTKRTEYARQRRWENPLIKLSRNLRNRVHHVLKNGRKSAKTMELVGCTFEQLREHFEALFLPDMSWKNYGLTWVIDHCRPLASFDLSDPAEQREAMNFMNLQPMFAVENLRKNAKPETEEQMIARAERYWVAP